MKPTIIILAAGLGTRMKSNLAKALHPLCGRPLIRYVLDAAAALDPEKIVLVLGHQADKVRDATEGFRTEVVLQYEQLGTGHAVLQAQEAYADVSGSLLILCADTPLVTAERLKDVVTRHEKSKAAVTFLSAKVQNPLGYGRVVRGKTGVMRIVEEKDASEAQKEIQEINTGIYCFDNQFLLLCLNSVKNDNAQREYYLPDTIALARKNKRKVSAVLCADPDEVMGVNTRYDLSKAEKIMQSRINRHWMLEGVTFLDPTSSFIGSDVSIGRDTLLYPHVRLDGKTSIGESCTVYPGSRIADSAIGDCVIIKDCSVILQSSVAAHASIGPFAHLRPDSVIGERAKIGNFVEVKRSTMGEGSKANHLSYIGDASVGRDVNIGAGVITCNYDGFEKHATIIEDGVFVGSDAQIVAPVRIGKGALIAAGSTITRDVPPDALGVSREPQENREGFASRRRRIKQKKGK